MPGKLLLGSKGEHFQIDNNKICGLSENIIQCIQYNYVGPLKICFPGCENITEIAEIALYSPCLRGVSSVDLSCMTSLEKICPDAFYQIGFDNEDFNEINLSCPNLKEISQNAFSQAGYNSHIVKLIFNCPKLQIIQDNAFRNMGRSYQYDNYLEYFSLDLSNCPKLQDIGCFSFDGYFSCIEAKQIEIKLPPNIKYIRQHAFGHINTSDEIIINISNKQHLQIIDDNCFQTSIKCHIIVNNCPELTIIGKQNDDYTEFFIDLDIDFDSCPKLQQVLGYDIDQYIYYQSIKKQHLLPSIDIYNMDEEQVNKQSKQSLHHQLYFLVRQHITQQIQLKDVKYKKQQVDPTINNLKNTLNYLRQQTHLQNEIIKQQHEQYMFLERYLESFNQRFGTEDDQ